MSKRCSLSGDSPTPKNLRISSTQRSGSSPPFDESWDFAFLGNSSDSEPPDFNFALNTGSSPVTPAESPPNQESQPLSFPPSQPSQGLDPASPETPPPLRLHLSPDDLDGEVEDFRADMLASSGTQFSTSQTNSPFLHQSRTSLKDALVEHIAEKGLKDSAEAVLENPELKKEIMRIVFQESHKSLKSSLKKSQLCADKKSRTFLLSISPSLLCQEFQSNSSQAFLLLAQGLLDISDPESIFDNQFLLNNVCFLYSTIAKVINRKATNYALLMTNAVRDGGLREDSIKLFPMFVHPRTSQKYDREILAKDWDKPLQDALQAEKEYFIKLQNALVKKSELASDSSVDTVDQLNAEIKEVLDSMPLQVQLVWDNLNLRTKHRFSRGEDDYAKYNFDWMASLFIKDRINPIHMDGGVPLKAADDLKIEDFVPTEVEKDYVFQSLVHYYSHRLVERHPMAFRAIKSSINPNKPHQFQAEMDAKSEEYTGQLFTKSESNTEDLIAMMTEIQKKYVHTYEDHKGKVRCFERKIISGDNKTEKNSTYGILRFTFDDIFFKYLNLTFNW